jgi:hypothetical protein
MPVPNDSKPNFQRINFLTETHCFNFSVIISFTFPRRSTQIQTTLILYTMATPTLKWPLRIGAPKSTSDNSTFSDNEGSNPNANDTPTFSQSSIISGYYNTSSCFNSTWSMDTPMLPGAMLTIHLWNGLCTRDLRW